jgi:hypothetical protein
MTRCSGDVCTNSNCIRPPSTSGRGRNDRFLCHSEEQPREKVVMNQSGPDSRGSPQMRCLTNRLSPFKSVACFQRNSLPAPRPPHLGNTTHDLVRLPSLSLRSGSCPTIFSPSSPRIIPFSWVMAPVRLPTHHRWLIDHGADYRNADPANNSTKRTRSSTPSHRRHNTGVIIFPPSAISV